MVFLPGARSIPSRVWLHGLPATKPWASFDLCAEHIHENHFPKVSWAGNARTPALLPQSLKPPPPAPTWTPSRAHWDTSRRGQSLQKEPQRPLALPLVKDEKLEAQAERWKVNRTQSEARLRSSSPPPPSATPRLLGRRPGLTGHRVGLCLRAPDSVGAGEGRGEEGTALLAFVVFSKCVQRGAKRLHVPSIRVGTGFGAAVPKKFPQRKAVGPSVLSRPNINVRRVFL